ncbi:hypothetical protein FITA111629_06285 [Filibacter tadaridae]|uniref:Uncharacterized protein n=1 Tax=Filibacter tadaridae TaxID=2483811 RepID=A0A3P5XRL8_9BACL|nr:hypothetical protein [Filibacter tadaridae]VDC33534.1 hypothetical protein FILTAD_02944 [Filibacter tadaridae]
MTESYNQTVSTITYIDVERKMGWFEQNHQHSVHVINLYANAISTTSHTFKLENVLDMSYRPFSDGTGLFYLHTNQGVFTYKVDTNPNDFILAYKKLRGDYSPF